MRRSRDSLWVVGLLALVALGAATFRLRSGVDGARSPQVQALNGAGPRAPVTLAQRSGDPRCCAVLLCDLARALPPDVYLAGLEAEPNLGTVRLACVATREGRAVDFDPIGSSVKRFEEVDCFGHASLHSGAPLATPMPLGAFELRASYRYDVKTTLSSRNTGLAQGMRLERDIFMPMGSGPPARQVLVLPGSLFARAAPGCSVTRFGFAMQCEAWVAQVGAGDRDCEILSDTPGPPGAYTIELDCTLEELASLLLTAGSRFEDQVGVRRLRLRASAPGRGKGSAPRLQVGLSVDFPREWDKPPPEPHE